MILLKDGSMKDIAIAIQELSHYEDLLRCNLSRKDREEIEKTVDEIKQKLEDFYGHKEEDKIPEDEKEVHGELREPINPLRFVVYRDDTNDGHRVYYAGRDKYTTNPNDAKLLTSSDARTIAYRMSLSKRHKWKVQEKIKRR